MAHRSIVVIDDFYDNPEEIRRLALAQTFERHGNPTYPGGQAEVPNYDWSPVWKRLRAEIDEAVDYPCPKPQPFPQGMFRLALAPDEQTRIDGIHQDAQRWSGVIYLARPEDCQGGVAFFRHRETGLVASTREFECALFGHLADRPTEEINQAVIAYLADLRNWEEIQRVAMRYNRAVLLMGQCFHMSVGVFGDRKENGRLTQHFEFYGENDGAVYG
ncbi:DUF6445 family protein [Piscinibacter gummiphilus]|uniref:DUF6445 family protein n=1 Tax=Piscinibacter gummiphilus TaxID=946333 RepID=A0ABZ0D288_9BURK|nr:DUF6445 family protein [Piscinibacter gummiphilus]WOB11349.1 DUF6445 family protein [Piscinibacter gummiphilus]